MLKHPSSPIIALAVAAKDLILAQETPNVLRMRLKQFVSELKDELAPDEKRRLDGFEAEAVIASFAAPDAPAQLLSSLVERHLERHQTPYEQPARSADSGE